jgi:hypothetical protein
MSLGALAAVLLLAGGFALALTDPVARELHTWMEAAVRVLP